MRHTYTSSAAAAERSVLLVNYENQRNAFKLVDIKSPPSPSRTVNDVIYRSPRRWLNDSSTSPSHFVAAPTAAALYPAAGPELCDCVYSTDLQPCGCPRFFQTSSALSASLPDVTSELNAGSAEDRENVNGGPEVYLSRDCVGRPTWPSSTVCRGCANVDAGPLPTIGDQRQQQQQLVDEKTTCWRSDEEDLPCCLSSRRASSTDAASEPVGVLSRQTST